MAKTKYLLQEAAVFLGVSYLVLLGGTLNGLVRIDLRTLNLVLLAVVGLGWFAWRILSKEPFPQAGFGLQVVIFVVAYGIATLLSIDPRRSTMLLGQIILYSLLLYFILDLRRRGWPQDIFVKSLLFVSGFIIFFGLLEIGIWLTSWWRISGGETFLPPVTIRIRAFIGHPNFAAAFLNLVLPLGLVQLFRSRAWIPRIALGLWTAIVIVLLYFTSSRGGWLGTAAALGSLAVLLGIDRRIQPAQIWRERPRLVLGLAGLAILSTILLIVIVPRQLQHPSHGSVSGSRSDIWGVALTSFISDPISGTGPFTYGSAFTATGIVPPGLLLAHAHNVVFNIAAEAGIIGLAALGFLLFWVAREIWYRWREHAHGERHWLAAFMASLTGFSIHSMFDTPGTLPALAMIAVILLAWLTRGASTSARRRLGNGLLVFAWLSLLAMIGLGLRSYRPLMDGLRAAVAGDWETATLYLDEAVEKDPALAYHWFQAGFADGVLAMDNAGQLVDSHRLSSAIQKYESGLAIDPNYAVNWANVAQLRYAGGDVHGAISDLEQATELAPNQSNFRLTLGRILEQQENLGAARREYHAALGLDDSLFDSLYFTANSFRQSVLASYPAKQSENPSSATKGWQALRRGDYETAVKTFSTIDPLNDPTNHLGRGLAYIGMGQLDDAWKVLTVAEYIGGRSGRTGAQIQNALGLVASARGDCPAAIGYLENSRSILDLFTSFGYAAGRSTDYGVYIYNRLGLPTDLLAGFVQAPYTEQNLAGLEALAECYEITGQASEARTTRLYLEEALAAPQN